MSNIEINDKRSQSDFRAITFSKYQKTKVKKELLQCLVSSKVEPACHWSAEFICSGHFIDLWEIIIYFISKYLHLGNPLLPSYIVHRIENFKNIMSNGYVGNELSLRNNPNIRTLFAELISTLCLSRKSHVFEPVKIKKEDEFNMSHMSTRLKAPNITYSANIFRNSDPTELLIAINEFSYNISNDGKNSFNACYWLEWIIEYDIICKKNKEPIQIERRDWAPVDPKYQMDPIWLIWGSILEYVKIKNCKITEKIINALLGMFCLRFTPGVRKRRRFLVYFAISLLTEPVNYKIPIWSNKDTIQTITKKIDVIYQEIKKNEEKPATDYLFSGVEKSNLDKTIERLEMMNNAIMPKNIIINNNDMNENV